MKIVTTIFVKWSNETFRDVRVQSFQARLLDVNCVDSLGRGALTLALEAENLEMVELLIVMEVQTKDALLHAIDQEFVEAVELLLEHEELLTASQEIKQNCESKIDVLEKFTRENISR